MFQNNHSFILLLVMIPKDFQNSSISITNIYVINHEFACKVQISELNLSDHLSFGNWLNILSFLFKLVTCWSIEWKFSKFRVQHFDKY